MTAQNQNSNEQTKSKPTHRLVRVDNHPTKVDENGYPEKIYTDLAALWETPKGKALSGKIGFLNATVLVLPQNEQSEDNTDEAGQ